MYLRRIADRKSYSGEELAEKLQLSRATISRWKELGLTPLPNHKAPYLYLGSEVKKFLKEKLIKPKVKLELDEYYCVVCKKAVKPDQSRTDVISRNKKLGENRQSVFFVNHCPNCKTKIIRFGSLPVNYQKPVARNPPIKPLPSDYSDQQSLF